MTNTAWRDRYETPTPETLVQGLEEELAESFSRLRTKLAEIGLREHLEWREPPWRWCLAYAPSKGSSPTAFLVPDPEEPRLACCFEAEQLDKDGRSVPKSMRAALLSAPVVEGVLWPEWPVAEIDPRFDEVRAFIEPRAPARGGRKA